MVHCSNQPLRGKEQAYFNRNCPVNFLFGRNHARTEC